MFIVYAPNANPEEEKNHCDESKIGIEMEMEREAKREKEKKSHFGTYG